MKFLLQKPYKYITILGFIVYFSLAVWLSDFITIFSVALEYAQTTSWFKLITSLVLSIIIAVLVSINLSYAYYHYALRKSCKKGATVASAGAVGGLFVGVCPVCVGGLLQVVLSILGISFSFAVLPWNGVEIQLLMAVLLGTNIWWMNKKLFPKTTQKLK